MVAVGAGVGVGACGVGVGSPSHPDSNTTASKHASPVHATHRTNPLCTPRTPKSNATDSLLCGLAAVDGEAVSLKP